MLKQLKYFQSVVRLNSFSEAAEENFISQSAISQQVQALERELGFLLLKRKNRSFTLTPAGEYHHLHKMPPIPLSLLQRDRGCFPLDPLSCSPPPA